LNDRDMAFLREVQGRGWTVVQAKEGVCIAACRAPGCQVSLTLRHEGHIPEGSAPSSAGDAVTDWQAVLDMLIRRRRLLRLSIEEVEEAAGLTSGHLSKIERGWRIPNVETLLHLFSTLGFDMRILSAPLPAPPLRAIATTRAKEPSRARRFAKPPRKLPRTKPAP